MLSTKQSYPVRDRITPSERKAMRLDTKHNGLLHYRDGQRVSVRAFPTGEHRCPREGEWYLSGAIIEAYRAPADLTSAYPIARLAPMRKVETWEVV